MLLFREAWFCIILLLTAFGLRWGLRDTRRVIEAPFLYAVGMAVILVPQVYVAVIASWRVPDEAFEIYCTMVMLCSIALYVGYFSKPRPPKVGVQYVIDPTRLFRLGLVIGLIGSFGYFQVYNIREIDEWRGWPVYWITLAKFALPGITLMVISYVQSRNIKYLVSAIIISIYPFLAIMTAGRRSMTIVLPLIYLLPFLLNNRKIKLPRFAVIGVVLLIFIIVYGFPYWRDQFKYGNYLQSIQSKPFAEIMGDMFSPDSKKVLEIIDGMIVTGARYSTSNYEWGVNSIWNYVVELYVPGSLLGYDFKKSLRIGHGVSIDWVGNVYGIPVAFYTAKSAYEELFSQFSFVGALFLFFVGKIFRRVQNAAVYMGDGRAIIFLCFFITLPASIPYGAILYGLVTQIPMIVVMLLSFRWCVKKRMDNHVMIRESASGSRAGLHLSLQERKLRNWQR